MPVALSTPVVIASDASVERAVNCLREGGLVAFPTETVYGLGADATKGAAVAPLYQAKGRPAFNPLIAHVADLDAAQQIGRFDAAALRLAEAFWPGPLTLVVPKAADCAVTELATAGLDTIAMRMPGASGSPRHPARARPAGGGAFGQSLRACFAHHRRPCAWRPRRSDRPDRRWRAGHGRGRNPPSSAALRSLCCCDRAGCRAQAIEARARQPLASRRPRPTTKRRWRRACWPRTMRPIAGCGSTPPASNPARRCWHSDRRCRRALTRPRRC